MTSNNKPHGAKTRPTRERYWLRVAPVTHNASVYKKKTKNKKTLIFAFSVQNGADFSSPDGKKIPG